MKSDKNKLFDEKIQTNSGDITLSEPENVDRLTQMMNCRAGKQKLEELILRAHKEYKMLSVILYDVNELKAVNDTYGEKEGDALLRYTASRVVSETQ